MLSVSKKYSEAISADVRDMPYRITLAGSVVLSGENVVNMTLEESVGASDGISIGTANSTSLKVNLRDVAQIDYDGMLVEPESGLVLADGSTEWIPLGKFWVTDSSTRNNYRTATLICADGMYHLTGDFESELEYPADIRDVVYEFVGKAGVDFVPPPRWPDLQVRRKPEKMTMRNAAGYLAGCCGCNARFNRRGQLEFVWYSKTGETIGKKSQYLDGLSRLTNKPLYVNFEITGEKEKYTVTVVSDGNGGVTATPGQNILEGDTVALSVSPFYGYELASIEAFTAQGDPVELFVSADGIGYTFIQPDADVTVTVAFRNANGGPYKLTVYTHENGSIAYDNSGNEKGDEFFTDGQTVNIAIEPNEGYEIDRVETIPADLGMVDNGNGNYEFLMPKSDVTISAWFKVARASYSINRRVSAGGGHIVVENTTTAGSTYYVGDVITVQFARSAGYVFDHYESNVTMTQIDSDEFRFTMPDHDVDITAYFAEEIDETKDGAYSFLQHPSLATPPENKPYWAVFYEHSTSVGANAKYYLVWFDSWSVAGNSITINGYYYCRGANNGASSHRWDTSAWSGNGTIGSSITWTVYYERRDEGKCLLATNVNLYKGSSVAFKRCDTAIGEAQTSYIVNGVDVREAGAMTCYPCPDTYSTPLPHANWAVLITPTVYAANGDDDYTKKYTGSTNLFAVYFDSVSSEWFEDEHRGYFKLKFPSVTIVQLTSSGFSTIVKHIDEECYVVIEDPNYSSTYRNGVGPLGENSCGLYATNVSIDGAFHDNSAMFCDCSYVASVSTFSLLRNILVEGGEDSIVIDSDDFSVSSDGDSIIIETEAPLVVKSKNGNLTISVGIENFDEITISYTNPMIYEKMTAAISDMMEDIAYTPAKVKHRGNPAFQAGDIVTVPDTDGNYHTVLIMQQTMSFGGGMNSEISCPGKTSKTRSFSSNGPMTAQIKREVEKSSFDIEHRLATNNALVFASMHKSTSATEAKLRGLVEWQSHASASIAEIGETASLNSASIELLTAWRDETNATIASISLETTRNGASISLLVENGEVKGGAVISAINGETTMVISADRVDVKGALSAELINSFIAQIDTLAVKSLNVGTALDMNGKNISDANDISVGGTITGIMFELSHMGNHELQGGGTLSGGWAIDGYSMQDAMDTASAALSNATDAGSTAQTALGLAQSLESLYYAMNERLAAHGI